MAMKTNGRTIKTYATTMKAPAVSFEALKAVIEHHGLEAADGQYQFTAEMPAHAIAIDEARGVSIAGMSPKKLAEDLKAAIEGKPQPNGTGWEEVEEEDIR
jgi:hypothetical protein